MFHVKHLFHWNFIGEVFISYFFPYPTGIVLTTFPFTKVRCENILSSKTLRRVHDFHTFHFSVHSPVGSRIVKKTRSSHKNDMYLLVAFTLSLCVACSDSNLGKSGTSTTETTRKKNSVCQVRIIKVENKNF